MLLLGQGPYASLNKRMGERRARAESNAVTRRWGPVLVALGALLWATDALWRSAVAARYSALFIVFLNHLLCVVITLPLLVRRRRALMSLSRREWLALGYIAVCGSALAMILFTEAFATAGNYSVPILLQKLQPVFAIALARWLLKERLTPRFALWAVLALVGTYLVSFGFSNALGNLQGARLLPVLEAVAAAAIWGGTTVAGRFLLAERDFLFVTSARFTLATAFLVLLVLATGELGFTNLALTQDIANFSMMALVSGLFALMIYYLGLKATKASVATLCELAFPVAAIVINWIWLDQPMSAGQLVGAGLLLAAVTAVSLERLPGA